MLLTNIKSSLIQNRVNLFFLDGSYLPFFVDDVVKLSLNKNQELDEEKLKQIKSLSLFYLGNNYSLRQIAISPKTEKILSQKLKKYFINITQKYKLLLTFPYETVIDQIITGLKEKKLLNESDYINHFIQKNKSKSVREIQFLLKHQGVNISSIDLSLNNDKDSIKKILFKKHINMELLADFNFKNKLYASLYRKGFQISDIKTAIDEYLAIK